MLKVEMMGFPLQKYLTFDARIASGYEIVYLYLVLLGNVQKIRFI
jgi:hypothetical protein